MSGLVELYETYETIRSCLQGEGYIHPGSQRPYTRDRQLQALTTRTASRLALYPDVDYAACREIECERCC